MNKNKLELEYLGKEKPFFFFSKIKYFFPHKIPKIKIHQLDT